MFFFSIFFLLGDLLLQHLTKLPNVLLGYIILPFSFIAIFYSKRTLKLFSALGFGFAFALFYSAHHLAWVFPKDQEGKKIIVTGYISSIPAVTPTSSAFLFSLRKLNNQPAEGLIKVSWRYPNHPLTVGDKWQLILHAKKIHGESNPGGFDYETYAFLEGIKAQGYVISDDQDQLISSHWYHDPMNRMRQSLKEKIEALLPHTETSPWIIALTVGERQGIAQSEWEVLRNTGTNHLMAIAGLHIGFMSGLFYLIFSYGWKNLPRLPLRIPAQHIGSIAALLIAIIYAALSGFNVPAKRACIMLSVFLINTLLRRKISQWHALSVAMLVVLLINPLSLLSESFWLSFGSVALIIYGVSGRLHPTGLWWKWGRIQWVIALGLIPLSIALFHQVSWVSFIANSIAIPWVACIIVPLCLFGTFCLLISSQLSQWIFLLADKNLTWLWKILSWFAHPTWATWYQYIPGQTTILLGCIGVLLLLLPKGAPGRWLGLIWLLPLLLYRPEQPHPGEVKFTLLDVGQGLSAIVQTSQHLLVFDAGEKLSESYDMGQSVVTPFLQSLHARKIDMAVVSNGENDHLGGMFSLLKAFPVREIKTSIPAYFPMQKTTLCLRNQSWNWDQVTFEFLNPTADNIDQGDNSSCVLKITTGSHSILLTSDIEKSAEIDLAKNVPQSLQVTILVAPHHGSKASAEQDFIEKVKPQYVLFPVGYRNRYHFPNATVMEKYQELGAVEFDTVNAGAIQFTFNANTLTEQSYRQMHLHYWSAS